ncbi:MAG: phage major tail tube protein [Alphaproteobacteria bacterium]|jgi:P2 family phage contractile tail tube protein|nr:phage major tail tube protein [Alphaproteobacteria bacterium]
MAIPKILKNFNLFVDGRGYVGKAEEVNPPKLAIKTEELRAGGMDSPIDIDMGMEKLEASFTICEYDKEILKQFGLVDGKAVQITLRGAMADDENTVPVVIKLRGMFKELDMGKFAAGEKSQLQCSMPCRYYSLNIDGEDIIEIDVDNMIRKVNGVDKLSEVRNALGI